MPPNCLWHTLRFSLRPLLLFLLLLLLLLQHCLLLLFNELKLPQLQCNISVTERRKGSDPLALHYHQHHHQHEPLPLPLPPSSPQSSPSFLPPPFLPRPPPPRDAEFYSTVCRIPVCSAHSSMQSNTARVEERWRQLSSAGCCCCCCSS